MRRLLPFLLILLFAAATYYVVTNKPEVKKRGRQAASTLTVETMPLAPQRYRVIVDSFGRIEPHTQGQLVTQVSGQIVAVSPSFRDGGFFQKGEVLVTIDPRDYEIQAEIVTAELANARVRYAEEQVLARQAKKDRQNLVNKGQLSEFALHIPQMAAAKQDIAAAAAKLEQARLNLERTRIRAPYAGRLLRKNADIGDVVGVNAPLASIYASDKVEIRLPVKNSELPFLELPERHAADREIPAVLPQATIGNRIGNETQTWQATVVRTAGAIEEISQQLHVIARIEDPFAPDSAARRPLKIGQYVTAAIEGRVIDAALVIPNAAIYQGSYVYLLVDGLLQRRDIEIAWQNRDDALLAGGLDAGEQLVLTPLGQVSSGTPAKRLAADGPAATQDKDR